MTNEESVTAIKSMYTIRVEYGADEHMYVDATDRTKSVLDMAVNALEKQIPKKPTYERAFGYINAKCPCCGRLIWTEGAAKEPFCWKCGQAIDWSEEE